MKKINKMIILAVLFFVGMLCMANICLWKISFAQTDRTYRISVNRVKKALLAFEREEQRAPADLEELSEYTKTESYPCITGLYALASKDIKEEELAQFLDEKEADYVVFATEGYYYKVTYRTGRRMPGQSIFWINALGFGMLTVLLVCLFYVKKAILQPFATLSEIPYELSKGNLSIPLFENKNRYFGRFVWGLDVLREKLEQQKAKELELQREKKMLLLSLSHDIKTPLSAIKLYAKAISKNLYDKEEKKIEVAENISSKVDEIESYISEIVKASHEDFLHFEVSNKEFYIGEALEQLKEYYEDKMALNQIDFVMQDYRDCMVCADRERLVEVLQNIMENAIKYGDGKLIRLETDRDEEAYVVRVINTGCTLSDKELLHIFDSFYRGSNVNKKPGSGLGLYICRQLMHLMEGEVTAAVYEEGMDRVMSVCVVIRLA